MPNTLTITTASGTAVPGRSAKTVTIVIQGTGQLYVELAGNVTVTVMNQGTSVGTFACPATDVDGVNFQWSGTTVVTVANDVNSLVLEANAVDGNSYPFLGATTTISF
jgi:hypothetical protein